MRRRGFLTAGVAAGAALALNQAVPNWHLLARPPGTSESNTVWFLSRHADWNRMASNLTAAGHRVVRVREDPVALWYDHIAPELDQKNIVRALSAAGSSFLFRNFSHLRGRFTPLPMDSYRPLQHGHEAWEISPMDMA